MLVIFKKFILTHEILKRISFSLLRIYLRTFKNQIIGKGALVGISSILEGKNSIGEKTSFIGSKIGFASYVSKNSELQNVKIGRYTSIGPDVKTIHGIHPTKKFVSTHPMFFSTDFHIFPTYTDKPLFNETPDKINPNETYTTEIGNDVWIGAAVNIIEGVKIGDGSIIASGAMVNKDVAPYSIVGGVPAKHIRYRFEPNEIAFLIEFKWWYKPEVWIKTNASLFSNIAEFIKNNEK